MNPFEGENKRKHQRFTATNLRIILKDDKNYRGEKIKDISLGGVFIRMENPSPVGTILTVTLDPKLGLGEIKLEGEVVWSSTKEGDADKGIGVKFRVIPDRVEEKLTKFFKTLKKV